MKIIKNGNEYNIPLWLGLLYWWTKLEEKGWDKVLLGIAFMFAALVIYLNYFL